MAFIPQCDYCEKVFKGGFINQLKKVVVRSDKTFTVDIVIRPPHLCPKCFILIMKDALKK